jgi:hypothetical protein
MRWIASAAGAVGDCLGVVVALRVLVQKWVTAAEGFIPSLWNYQKRPAYQKSEIAYDATICFCDRFFDKGNCTRGQVIRAARPGKRNISDILSTRSSKNGQRKKVGIADV